MFEKVKEKAAGLQKEMVGVRRQIHSNPELGFEEWETSKLVKEKMSALGLEVTDNLAKTGVAALLTREGCSRTVALRADMDALRVQELNDVPYKSVKPGVMHACGHDAHVAMLVGAAGILNALKDELKVNVKFLFQPSEESAGGALPMIEQGVLENPYVDAIFGLHVHPYLPVGTVGVKEGAMMAAADVFTLEIIGKGGHGAVPHQSVDPILTASHVIIALQSIVSRQTDPVEPVVLSICSISGGQSYNVIPDRVILKGTVRTLNKELQRQMPERIRSVVGGVTSSFGADFKLDYEYGYPALINNTNMVEVVRNTGCHIVGKDRISDIGDPSMGAEDFSYFVQKVPGAFFFLGVKPEQGEAYPWHNPRFDLDESVLSVGAAMLAGCVFNAQEILAK